MYIGGSKAIAKSKMERFVITKRFILDVAAALDPPLHVLYIYTPEKFLGTFFSVNVAQSCKIRYHNNLLV